MSLLAADKLRLIVTGECNLACFYCHNEGQSEKRFYLDPNIVRDLCDLLSEAHVPVREVTISGGEPTLHPALTDLVGYARGLTSNVTMVSNGVAIDAATVADLAHAGLRKLRLGVDSLRDGKSRPSPGNTVPALPVEELISIALASGVDVDLNVVLTRFNAREISALARLALRHGTDMKFFEHVDVDHFSSATNDGTMTSRPHVSPDSFLDGVGQAGEVRELPADPAFGAANLRYAIDGIEIRYCRFLCPYRLCWTTGTRVDPSLFVYNCMLNHGLDRLSARWQPSRILEVLTQASARECDARRDGVAVPG